MLYVLFVNVYDDTYEQYFKKGNVSIFRTYDLDEMYPDLFLSTLAEKKACQLKVCEWSFVRMLNIQPKVNVHSPLRASSFMPLPQDTPTKRVVVNVLNDGDERRFEYSILSKYIINSGIQRLKPFIFTSELRAWASLNFGGLHFQVRIEQICTFKHNNPSVTVNL